MRLDLTAQVEPDPFEGVVTCSVVLNKCAPLAGAQVEPEPIEGAVTCSVLNKCAPFPPPRWCAG